MREETTDQQLISVWVRDPRIQKNDFWHAYIDYEICLHVNVCDTCVTRHRPTAFASPRRSPVNCRLMIKLPDLPPKNPFFSLNNAQQITDRMKGLQKFLEQILQSPLLLSDSCLHLFLQSELRVSRIEACAAGKTSFSVAQAVQGNGLRRFHSEEDLQKDLCLSCDSDSDRYYCREPDGKFKELTFNKSTASLDSISTWQEEMLNFSPGST
uniref:Sorting nexin 10b n=1 Tax=Nothobranchius furzeri TaxID=105023 RepID=A0A8C6VYU5_NOTFU